MNLKTFVIQSIDKARRGDLFLMSSLIDRLRFKGYHGIKFDYNCIVALFARYGCEQDELETYLESMDDIESTTRYSNAMRY